ncbi:MAG: AMP-dependent synthetase [Porticoccaceae bacterium]|nr:MAG: AMP-dependent synthetase [Porticoccaceae bacterium]
MIHTSQTSQFMFRNALWRHAARTALVVGGRSYTYRELDSLSSTLAAGLAERGIARGDRLAIMLRNSVEFAITDLAIFKLGAVKVPLNELLSQSDVSYMIGHSGAKALVLHGSLADKLDSAALVATDLRNIIEVDDLGRGTGAGREAWSALFAGGERAFEWREVQPQDPAFILYTGGTTGRSKGVLHTHRSMMINGLTHLVNGEIGETEQMLLTSPLPHAAGFFLQAGFLAGACVHVHDKFDAERVIATVINEKITWTFMVPTMIYRVLDAYDPARHDLSSLRTLVYGAAPITRVRLQEVLAKLGPVLLQLFGQTEVPDFATKLSKADHLDERFLGSCGQPVLTAEVGIGDPMGRPLPFGEVGEIMVRSPYTLESYYNDPQKTAEVYVGEWIRTGDVGYQIDSGHVFIVDRSKDMIITGGMNVYSSEVENAVQEYPGVRQVMVIGIPHEDWGEAVCAAVIPAGQDFDADDLIAFCKQRLAAYKVPKVIEVVADIPLTAYGKPDKKTLRAKYWGAQTRQVN